MTQQQTKELELLKQLIGEWSVGIAMKTSDDKVVSGCGDMTAVEIDELGVNSEMKLILKATRITMRMICGVLTGQAAKCIFSA